VWFSSLGFISISLIKSLNNKDFHRCLSPSVASIGNLGLFFPQMGFVYDKEPAINPVTTIQGV